MDAIIIAMLMAINIVIMYNTMDKKRDEYKDRCEELKSYIRFLETSHHIEDAHEGAQWLEERAQRRLSCDIQDLNK